MNKEFLKMISEASSNAMSGHFSPDGDCIGACLALCTYILDQYPEKTVDIFMEPIQEKYRFLKCADRIRQEKETEYDLYVALDCSEPERLGPAYMEWFQKADRTICVDHHLTNKGFGDLCIIVPGASSTCEILFDLFDEDKISLECAESLFTGLVHDTGVFCHSNTSKHVMEIAACLIGKGVNSEKIISETFRSRTYRQNLVLGRALLESILILDRKVIFSVFRKKDFEFYGVDKTDLDNIVAQLKATKGVETAIFLYETGPDKYKVSLRSGDRVNVAAIASLFGGGGHRKASGCTVTGKPRDIVMNIAAYVEEQLEQSLQ